MVVYTKPRQEKSLARDFLRQTIPFYLPLVKKTLQYGRRRIASFAPLFDGYLFMLGSEKQRLDVVGDESGFAGSAGKR